MKKDLTYVCNYLKGLIIPDMSDDFVIAAPFKYDLPDEELRKGIAAFHTFLHVLYDSIATEKNEIDVAKGAKYDPEFGEDSIHKCFPIINEVAIILSTLGLYGTLETAPRKMLVVNSTDLLTPLSSTKPPAMNKINNKRKRMLFEFLSNLGFYFEGLDFSESIDFSKVRTFYVTYEDDDFVILGMKLLAAAKGNIKSGYQKFMTTFMRCDFYPLANVVPKAHAASASEFANSQPIEIRDWVVDIEKLLMENGCRISCFFLSNTNGDGSFSYISQKGKKTVCRIAMGITGCLIEIRGNHFVNENNILPELPEEMLSVVKSGGCGDCAANNPNFKSCRHGGPIKFIYNGEDLERCAFGGYVFELNDQKKRELLKKWLELELA